MKAGLFALTVAAAEVFGAKTKWARNITSPSRADGPWATLYAGTMKTIQPEFSIVPIVRAKPDLPVSEVLGTGFFVGNENRVALVTAKHVFAINPLGESEKYAYAIRKEKGIEVWAIRMVVAETDYDIAVCEIETIPQAVPLSFSGAQPALNDDVFCYEYSTTRFGRKPSGGMHISFEPLSHKGNIMRYFDSTFPESRPTPSFLTSFPALQGASGAPVMAGTKNKQLYVAGMMVANKESRLLPAQIVKIQDGNEFIEEVSYFLPTGKAINATVLIDCLKDMDVDIDIAD